MEYEKMANVEFHVIRVQKVQLGNNQYNLDNAEAHQNRIRTENSNSDHHIDYERTKNNQILTTHLADKTAGLKANFYAYAEENDLLDKEGRPKFIDKQMDTVLAEFVVSASPEYFDRISPGWRSGDLSPEFHKWKENAENYFKTKYDKKLIFGQLHLDEDTPHLHFFVVPDVTQTYKKPGRLKQGEIRKSEVIRSLHYNHLFSDLKSTIYKARKENRSDVDTKLGRLQTDYADHMAQHGTNDLQRGLRNSRATHKHFKLHKQELMRQARILANSKDFKFPDFLKNAKPAPNGKLELSEDEVKKLQKFCDELKLLNFSALAALADNALEEQKKLQSEIHNLDKFNNYLWMQNKEKKEKIDKMMTVDEFFELQNKLEKSELEIKKLNTEAAKTARAIPLEQMAEMLGLPENLRTLIQLNVHFYPGKPVKIRNSLDLIMAVHECDFKTAVDTFIAMNPSKQCGDQLLIDIKDTLLNEKQLRSIELKNTPQSSQNRFNQ
jgi:hypothetical protein